MLQRFRVSSTTIAWLQIAALVLATLTPILASTARVDAAQLGNRFIRMSNSNGGQTGVTYSFSFVTTTASNLNGVAIQFCDDSPIIGDACSVTSVGNVSGATISNQVGATFTVDGANTTTSKVVLTGTNTSVPAGTTVSFDLSGIVNPTADNQSFYSRIVTYASAAGAQAYAAGTPGTHVDDGGIALSTAQQINITARVQERLEFCVGNVDPTANCTGAAGNAVDLGVLDTSTINLASINGDTTNVAHLQVSTNASSGVTIGYYATELQVSGATCSGTSTTDECINEAGATANTIVAGTEEWGMRSSAAENDGTTTNLSLDANYNSANYALNVAAASTTLATSSTVTDSEGFNLDFAGTVNATTPTGLYESTLTFVATGTF